MSWQRRWTWDLVICSAPAMIDRLAEKVVSITARHRLTASGKQTLLIRKVKSRGILSVQMKYTNYTRCPNPQKLTFGQPKPETIPARIDELSEQIALAASMATKKISAD